LEGAHEEYTPEQESAIQHLVDAFRIKHGKIHADIEAYEGKWTKADVGENRRFVRKSDKRRRI